MEDGGPGQERPSCAAEADVIASAVAEVAADLWGDLRLDAVYAAAVAQLERLLEARIALLHGTEDGSELRLAAARSGAPELLGLIEQLGLAPAGAPSLAAQAAAAWEVQRVHRGDAAAADLADARAIFARTPCAWVLAAPLLAGGRLVGVVSCGLTAPGGAGDAGAVDLQAALLRALAGVIAMAIGAARDREQAATDLADFIVARDALREAEERLDRTIDDAPIGMAVVALDGRFLRVNRALCRILGYAREELADLRFQDITHPDDLEADLSQAARLVRGEIQGYQLAKRYLRKEGRVIDALMSGSMVRDALGRPLHFIAQVQDVTEQKRAEDERERLVTQLAAERRWLHSVIEESPVGIVLVEGPDGRRIAANRRMEELIGMPLAPEGGMAQYARQVCAPEGATIALEDLPGVRALQGEMTRGRELLLVSPDQRAVPVLASAGPIHDHQGRILGAAVIYEDISPLKELERLREEWTSLVAHDLRQPVTIITGYAAVLARKAEEPFRSWARHMLESARRLDRMIGDLHEASRIDARQLTVERQPTDLLALVAAVVQRLAPECEGRPVTVDASGEIPPVDLDPGRIEQVLGNLLSNALKYGDPGTEILVTVAARGADEVEVSVQNRGPGIAPADLPRLFQRFQRGTSQGAKRADSTGLGLYICRGIVEAHGGRIWAESSPGDTTAFRFTLHAPAPASAPGAPASSTSRVEPQGLDAPVSSAARG